MTGYHYGIMESSHGCDCTTQNCAIFNIYRYLLAGWRADIGRALAHPAPLTSAHSHRGSAANASAASDATGAGGTDDDDVDAVADGRGKEGEGSEPGARTSP